MTVFLVEANRFVVPLFRETPTCRDEWRDTDTVLYLCWASESKRHAQINLNLSKYAIQSKKLHVHVQ